MGLSSIRLCTMSTQTERRVLLALLVVGIAGAVLWELGHREIGGVLFLGAAAVAASITMG